MTRWMWIAAVLVACGGKTGDSTTPTTGSPTGTGTGTATGTTTGTATGTGTTTGTGTATGTGTTTGTGTATGTGATCAIACHGSATTEAPPPDTSGNTATTERGVGAHQTHLAGANGAVVACADCHVVPATPADPGHLDGALPAEVTFSGLAVADGASPSWDGASLTCSDAYCHGGGGLANAGGTLTSPTWNVVDGSQNACGACHSLPPPAPHPAQNACETCHGSVAGAGPVIANPSLHVNGSVDF